MISCWQEFLDLYAALPAPSVLEVGSRVWPDLRGHTVRQMLYDLNPVVAYTGFDVMSGDEVDVVGDAHDLAKYFPAGHFDVFLCRATLEHVRRPWVVAAQLAAVVKPGGIGFVQTHQTFPLHGYPHDYFRFSTAALRELFADDGGWKCLRAEHEFPCRIVPMENYFPHAQDWNFVGEAYLNSCCLVRRLP